MGLRLREEIQTAPTGHVMQQLMAEQINEIKSIPLGTANVLAHELNLSFAPTAVAGALAFGRTRELWPGIASSDTGSKLFVQMLGTGFDAQVVHHLSLPLKRALGKAAYVLQGLRETLRYRFPMIPVTIDGTTTEAGSVIVTKGRYYAGRHTLAPDACVTAPGFTIALFDRSGPFSALAYGAALPLNLLGSMPGIRLLRGEEIRIGPHMAQTDGYPAGSGPIVVRNAATPIRVVV
jgi:diacylglycerol kinase family enzyme